MTEQQSAYNNPSRDLRLDFIRGYLIVVMIIDHIGGFPAWTQLLTGAGKLWISAAEGFVVVSGVVFGMLYHRHIPRRGWYWVIAKIAKRAILLFGIAVVWQFIFSSIDYGLHYPYAWQNTPPSSYFELIKSAVFQIRDVYIGVDLLQLYAVLLLWGLLILYLLYRGKSWWVIILTVFTWLAQRIARENFIIFTTNFPPASWQLLFTMGILAGYHREWLADLWQKVTWNKTIITWLMTLTSFVALWLSYRIIFHQLWSTINWLHIDQPIFEKVHLGPGRAFLTFWIMTAFYLFIDRYWGILGKLFGWFLIPMGQNALFVYVVHASLIHTIFLWPEYWNWHLTPFWRGCFHLAIVLALWAVVQAVTRAGLIPQKAVKIPEEVDQILVGKE